MVILSEEILSEIFTNSVNVTHILDREIDKIENKDDKKTLIKKLKA